MKKIFQKSRFKKYNQRKSRRGQQKRKRKFVPEYTSYKDSIRTIKDVINSPKDFRLIENLDECVVFLRKLRSKDSVSNVKGHKSVEMSLSNVQKIDFGIINILTAISDDFLYKNIILKVNLPTDLKCKNYITESGFLNRMYDSNGNKINAKTKSDMIFFEKGTGKLSERDNKKISEMVRNAVLHLTGESKHCLPIKTLILEICGNSIEWGNTSKKQWLFGLKYDENRVIFTVTDVGLGILKTLHRKFGQIMNDIFSSRSSLEILIGAFQKKYNSSTLEENRNKGLPSIRINHEIGNIKNLTIITNDVILHYDNEQFSRTLTNKSEFRGTFYKWEMDLDCMNKIYNNGN